MKTVKIILIAILCGLLVFLGVVLGWGVRSGSGSYRGFSRPYTLAKEWEVPAAEIESLYMNYGMNSNDVYLYEGTGENIVIREYTNFTEREDWLSVVEQQGNTLTVKGKRRRAGLFLTGIWGNDAYVEIYLPSGVLAETEIVTASGDICSEADWTGGSSFAVRTSSGDIDFAKVEAEKITAEASSGSITFHSAEGEVSACASSGDISFREITGNAEIATSSGEIKVERIAGNAKLSASSGDVRLGYAEGDVRVSTTSGEIAVLGGAGARVISASSGSVMLADVDGWFEIKTNSGEITLESGTGYGEAKASSGDVDISLNHLEGSLNIGTTSGEVNISIPADASFAFSFDSASGECSTFFDDCLSYNRRGTSAEGDYGSRPDKEVEISTTSGSAYIWEK